MLLSLGLSRHACSLLVAEIERFVHHSQSDKSLSYLPTPSAWAGYDKGQFLSGV